MSHILVTRSSLSGTVEIPSSKSHTFRALLFALLAEGRSTIRGILASPDTEKMFRAMRAFGCRIQNDERDLIIDGVGIPKTSGQYIDVGNSGILLRFLGALAGCIPDYTLFDGDSSITSLRPAKPLLSALQQLGCFAQPLKKKGFAPFLVRGGLRRGSAVFDGADSQPVSGMLIASALSDGPFELLIENPGETPWIDLTLDWMSRFSLNVERDGYSKYYIPGNQTISAFTWTVPGDLSSLAFPLAAALITRSHLSIANVDLEDVQGDKVIVEHLRAQGADIRYSKLERKLDVFPSTLCGGEIDVNECIDALPILAVLGCYCERSLTLRGGSIARQKECDRIAVMCSSLRAMGARIEEFFDGMKVCPSSLTGTLLSSYNDHRVALSLMCAGLGASGITRISGYECIQKTYPTFATDMRNVGATIYKDKA